MIQSTSMRYCNGAPSGRSELKNGYMVGGNIHIQHSSLKKKCGNSLFYRYYVMILLLLVSNASCFAPSSIFGKRINVQVAKLVRNVAPKAIMNDDDKLVTGDKMVQTAGSANDLQTLGWQPYFADQISDNNINDDLTPVRIIEVLGKSMHVLGTGIDRLIPISGRRKKYDDDAVVVVGDWILLNNEYRQKKILKRKSLIKRRAPGPSRKIQFIAANLDTVFVVSSCNQDFNVARLERYVAMILEANVTPVIVLTKRDLCVMDDVEGDDDEDPLAELLDLYLEEARSIAGGTVPVVCLDARGSEPFHKLGEWCRAGQTVAFLGSSGVGKSTLVNSLCESNVAETADIHVDSGQGRHTTTRRQLHFLKNECALLDTPGLRELQLIDASHGVNQVFRDLVDLSRQCRFNDCKHAGEPGCAIEEALDNGDIDEERFLRWEKLVAEDLLSTNEIAERKKVTKRPVIDTKLHKYGTKKKRQNDDE